jgi:hypothetical protein
MAKSTSSLASVFAKKGDAAPAVPAEQEATPKVSGTGYYKALTVKLDKERYLRLKQAGLSVDKSNQDIFVAALDAYLSQHAA